MHLYILMLLLIYRSCAKFIGFPLVFFSLLLGFESLSSPPRPIKLFTYIFSSFWKLYMAVAYCFLKDREGYHKSRSAFVSSPFLLPILIHRRPFGFWWFYFSHFSFSHQLEFILLCGLKWKSNLRIFFFQIASQFSRHHCSIIHLFLLGLWRPIFFELQRQETHNDIMQQK